MTNHVHLLLTPDDDAGLSALMRDLGQRYVQYFNRRHGRSGTLWEGRYRSCIVESTRYVLACYRYVELNPVRAGMVTYPSSYLWSSHAANSGMRSDPFIVEHPVFRALADEPVTRHAAYRGLFEGTMDEPLLNAIREATNAGYPLVSESFLQLVAPRLGLQTGPRKPGPAAMSPAAVYSVS
jgi:putative transposase